jgi:hypothetical protein
MEFDDVVRVREASGLIFAVAQYVPSTAGLHGPARPNAPDMVVRTAAKTIRCFTNLIFFPDKSLLIVSITVLPGVE